MTARPDFGPSARGRPCRSRSQQQDTATARVTGAATSNSNRCSSLQDKKYIIVEAGMLAIVVVNDSSIVMPGQVKRPPGNCDDAENATSIASSGGLFSICWPSCAPWLVRAGPLTKIWAYMLFGSGEPPKILPCVGGSLRRMGVVEITFGLANRTPILLMMLAYYGAHVPRMHNWASISLLK